MAQTIRIKQRMDKGQMFVDFMDTTVDICLNSIPADILHELGTSLNELYKLFKRY